MIITESRDIAMYHYLAQLHACRLHLRTLELGMKFSRRSPIAHVKRTYGYTGTNVKVVEQFSNDLYGENPTDVMRARVDAVIVASAA